MKEPTATKSPQPSGMSPMSDEGRGDSATAPGSEPSTRIGPSGDNELSSTRASMKRKANGVSLDTLYVIRDTTLDRVGLGFHFSAPAT